MSALIDLTCKNCGGSLHLIGNGQYHCEYCGSTYELDNRGLPTIKVYQSAPVQTITCVKEISRPELDFINENNLSEYTLRDITHQLAEGLAGFLRLDTTHDRRTDAIIVRGTVRVVPPDWRF